MHPLHPTNIIFLFGEVFIKGVQETKQSIICNLLTFDAKVVYTAQGAVLIISKYDLFEEYIPGGQMAQIYNCLFISFNGKMIVQFH